MEEKKREGKKNREKPGILDFWLTLTDLPRIVTPAERMEANLAQNRGQVQRKKEELRREMERTKEIRRRRRGRNQKETEKEKKLMEEYYFRSFLKFLSTASSAFIQ